MEMIAPQLEMSAALPIPWKCSNIVEQELLAQGRG
jgi:hypothetical protein